MKIQITMPAESRDGIRRRADNPARFIAGLSRGLLHGLVDMESHLKRAKLSGIYSIGQRRDGKGPLAVRSGALRQAATHARDEELSGYVGIAEGPASAYARMLLGPDDTTVKPKKAKHLWIPVADNLNGSGQARLSPGAAFDMTDDKGKRLLRIFRSKKGNLVAGLSGKVPGVRRKGFKLLFVLKDEVTVKGTDGLAQAVDERTPQLQQFLNAAIAQELNR